MPPNYLILLDFNTNSDLYKTHYAHLLNRKGTRITMCLCHLPESFTLGPMLLPRHLPQLCQQSTLAFQSNIIGQSPST